MTARSTRYAQQHYEQFAGLRPKLVFQAYDGDMNLITVTPKDFFVKPNITKAALLFGTNTFVHLPRSLCRRARIQVKKGTTQKTGESAMHTVQPTNKPRYNRSYPH